MPEVFILCEYPTLNGAERSMLSTLDGIRTAGFEPVVIGPASGKLADVLRARNIRLIAFSCTSEAGQRIPQHRLREELSDILSRFKPRLLHANSLAMARLVAPVADDLKISALGHIRDIVRLSPQAVVDLNRLKRILVVSHATRNFHIASGIDSQKTHVLYNGVDLQCFRPQSPTGYLHRQLHLPADVQFVATIGQLSLRKGQDVLLRAAAKIAENYRSVHWLVVGQRYSDKEESRRFERSLKEMANSTTLVGRVHFLGEREDVAQLLNEIAILVHPARQEPLGRVLLEAAASAVPIIATDVGGTAEIFPPHAKAAILIEPDDHLALCENTARLLENRVLRETLALSARQQAEARFDLSVAVKNLVRHYSEVVGI